jgi:hypothetical protein
MNIRYELSLRFSSRNGARHAQNAGNKGFSRAGTLDAVGFTPNMG